MNALVTNAENLITLSIIRSLGRRGVVVTGGSERNYALGLSSKYCANGMTYTSPKNEKQFLADLLDRVRKNKYDVLFPSWVDTMIPVSYHREKFMKYTRIPLAEHEKILTACNKYETLKLAMENDIPCPKTHLVHSEKEISALKEDLVYPSVIKPTDSFGAKGVAYVQSYNDLLREYRRISKTHKEILLQECIPLEGEIYGMEALFNADSEPRAVFVHKRLRQYPVTGGSSTLRESVSHPEVERLGLKLLKALNWYGVAMVEFKMDTRDNTPKLMEINPRFWGSLPLSIAAGVDFPYLLYKLAMEGDVEKVRGYKKGVKCRLLFPDDIRHFISVMTHDYTHLGLKKQSKKKAFFEFMKFYEKDLHYDLLSLEDPGPSFAELKNLLFRKIKRNGAS